MLTDDENADGADVFIAHEPSSYQEATRNADSDKWKVAMDREIQVLKDHNTWTSVSPSEVKQKSSDFK